MGAFVRACFPTQALLSRQDVAGYGRVEQLLDPGPVRGLAQDPHQLGAHRLAGHVVGLQDGQVPLDARPHVVHGQIAALVLHLGGHHHGLARLQAGLHGVVVVPGLVGGQAAHAEALDNQRVVALQQVLRHPAVRPRNQLHKGHPGVDRLIELGHRTGLRPDIADDPPIPDHAQKGVVDAGEGLKALAAGLPGPGAQDDLAVEHQHDPGHVRCGHGEGVPQVLLAVGGLKADGPLGACEDDGLGTALDQVAQTRGGVGHGVRAVADHEAVVLPVAGPDGRRHAGPVLGLDVGAVQVEELGALHLADAGDIGDIAQQLLAGQLRRKAALPHLGGDGAPGADQQNLFLFHGCLLHPILFNKRGNPLLLPEYLFSGKELPF